MPSAELNELAAALVAAQGEFTAIPRGSENPYFHSSYADLATVVTAAAPILAKNGLAVSQFPAVGQSGGPVLTTYLMHKSGQYISHEMPLNPVKSDPQALGSAITYARRYAYSAVLGLVTETDDDGNTASQPAPKAKAAPVKNAEPLSPADLKRNQLKALASKNDWTLEAVAEAYAKSVKLADGKPGELKTASAEDVEAFIRSVEGGLVKV